MDFGTAKGIEYAHTVEATRRLGKIIGDPSAAEKLIARYGKPCLPAPNPRFRHIAAARLRWCSLPTGRHLRIYGKTSLFQAVFDKLELNNAWTGKSNEWGFENITLLDLAKLPPDTLLIIVKPHPQNTRATLEKSALWQRLPFSRPANRRIFEPSWSYGALPSMQRFTLQLMRSMSSENPSAQKEVAW